MYNTYKNMRRIAEMGKEMNDISNLAERYQQNQDMVYLSVIFCEYFPYIRQTADNYINLTDEDKSSYILEEIHKSLMDYDASRNTKIQTIMMKYIKNRLRSETQQTNMQKRKANNQTASYDNTLGIFEGKHSGGLDRVEMDTTIEQMKSLSENEKEYCKIVSSNDYTDSDVARVMNVTASAINQMKKRIKRKITENMITA